jgi:uncharacterized protein YeaO (DUF488 family)
MADPVRIKRIYEPADAGDGQRVLVDRLWPRGVSKAKAALDLWLKEIAPSEALRHWFGHDPALWPEFRQRYAAELDANPATAQLCALLEKGPVTLLYAVHDEAHSNALALADYLAASEQP